MSKLTKKELIAVAKDVFWSITETTIVFGGMFLIVYVLLIAWGEQWQSIIVSIADSQAMMKEDLSSDRKATFVPKVAMMII